MKKVQIAVCALALVVPSLVAQGIPQALYYRFNEGTGTTLNNAALPGTAPATATVNGGLAFAPGMFGYALFGTGAASSTDYVSTGWSTTIGASSFTIEFWLNNGSPGWLSYWCGDPGALSLRVFSNGAAGNNNIVMRVNGGNDVVIPNAVAQTGQWHHVAWAWNANSNPPVCVAYFDGLAVASVNQPTGLVFNGGTGFSVGGFAGSTSMLGGIDEFRVWLSALTPAQVWASWNNEILATNILSVQTAGMGVGNMVLSLTGVSPGASEGFILPTAQTTLAPGSGPAFGIWPDSLTYGVIVLPAFPGNPLHFPTGYPGVFPAVPLVSPNGTLSFLTGQTWDIVAAVFGPGGSYIGQSNVVRVAW